MNIKEKIRQDLSQYDQDCVYPKSLTIVEGNLWRHYELGEIYGFCIYNNEEGRILIISLREDDMFWSIPDDNMNMSAFWIKEVNKTWNRTVKWSKEHIKIGFNKNRIWEEKVIKEIL